ncbi:ABC transporter ATP-binding protein [Desulfovirgula thermocuniculi]|uniref:ABC transporter ATP-binding protein n=1 Tax=Desulfovirgula thermocuniculi TaxID=348842 RepID=UPI000423E567|nr:ABC transporter ATP-binding protein [Desulfovirgula thermocuniculi]
MALFKVENLTYYYPASAEAALRNISLEIREGEFLLLVGASGSGKSTLARVLAGLIPDFYGGKMGGRVLFKGREMRTLDRRQVAREVGMVFQDPERQLVKTQVEAEVAFGLENLGLPLPEMRRRVAEVLAFMGLEPVKGSFIAHLSGGQKQKLALASVLAMQPRVLVLDEPTSQLDPASAEEILQLVRRLNEETGLTVVLAEQRLERCLHLADRVILLARGEVVCEGRPAEVAQEIAGADPLLLPPVARFFTRLGVSPVPITVKEGRQILLGRLRPEGGPAGRPTPAPTKNSPVRGGNPAAVEMQGVWYTYPQGNEALKGVSLNLQKGEFAVILGANGAGKTTLVKQMVGLLRPDRGKVWALGKDVGRGGFKEIRGRVAYLSQNPNDYLFQDTVEGELLFTIRNLGLNERTLVDELLERLGLLKYRNANPRELSSGERQRVALASVLVARPQLIVLDEPTRGIDYRLKAELGRLLREEAEKGCTVVVVTHDVEFAAEYARQVVIMHGGEIVAEGEKHALLGNSLFYSPQMARLCRGFCEGVLTVAEAVEKLGSVIGSGSVREGVPEGERRTLWPSHGAYGLRS